MVPVPRLPPPLRRTLAEWLGRLADRLIGLKEQVQDGVIESVGRTAAEAAESALRRLFGIGLSRPTAAPKWPDVDNDPDAWDETSRGFDLPSVPETPLVERTGTGWSWQALLVAALHAIAWWLRRRPAGPIVAAIAIVFGAAVCLMD